VDHDWCKVGSSNLNSSSLARNYELDVLVTDHVTAQAAADQFRLDLGGAAEVVLRPRRVRRMPPAVVSTAATPAARPRLARGERSRRAVVSLRSLAVGARRSIAGAVVFTSVGAGVFALYAPRVLASLVAFVAFTLAGRAIWNFLWRRREREY
ncbi:MAG TPA: phospholipase D-like domain-containing protein, partial [Gemmatimonadales bacterium]